MMQQRPVGIENLDRIPRYRRPCVFLFSAAILMIAGGCLWDYDTLKDERSRFPEVLELIAGKFPRHSKAFYQWRIKDRLARLEKTPDDLSLQDDLAVAYDKTGASADAISVGAMMLEKEPERYETLANLGTFYFHAGQFEKGLPFIEKAIAINPNAHFGREKTQLLLVKYVIAKQKDGQTEVPLAAGSTGPNFATYVAGKQSLESFQVRALDGEELKETLEGVTGMMRFSKHDSPILLEALGDLLNGAPSPRLDARLLAIRAYLSASYSVNNETARDNYRAIARKTLENGVSGTPDKHYQPYKDLTFDVVEDQLKKELAEGTEWFRELETNEKKWIEAGDDVESKFDATYRRMPRIESESTLENRSDRQGVPSVFLGFRMLTIILLGVVGLVIATAALLVFAKVCLRKR